MKREGMGLYEASVRYVHTGVYAAQTFSNSKPCPYDKAPPPAKLPRIVHHGRQGKEVGAHDL
jgi:hypothetical protein